MNEEIEIIDYAKQKHINPDELDIVVFHLGEERAINKNQAIPRTKVYIDYIVKNHSNIGV